MISVVLLTYNRLEMTKTTLESLVNTIPADVAREIVAVDNRSIDGTAEYLKSVVGPTIDHLVMNGRNQGSAHGFNIGLRLVKGDWILVTDNDYEFLPGWLQECLGVMAANPSVGAISPCDNRGAPKQRHLMAGPRPYLWETFNVPTCFLIRPQIFTTVGLFPAYGHLYGATDTKFCQDVRSHDWRLAYTVDPLATHLDKATQSQWRTQNEREANRVRRGDPPRPELIWSFRL